MDSSHSNSLNIVTYNFEGISRSSDYVKDVLSSLNIDVMCLQETWLLEQNIANLGAIHDDYLFTGKSGTDSTSDILIGRPMC